MNEVIFATTNERKVREATTVLTSYGVTIVVQKVQADEIQHQDPAEITKAKVKAAYDILQKPVVVQDTSWQIPALNGFPGGYMKDVASWFTPEDWMALMGRHDRTIVCYEHIAYYDGENLQHFQSSYSGVFTDKPAGVDGDSLDKTVSILEGKTMAEMHDEGLLAAEHTGLDHWKQFAEWYTESHHDNT